MFEQFTDTARHVVRLAEEEARRLNHDYIGTEHVLLGLLAQDQDRGRDIALAALAACGAELTTVRREVEQTSSAGQQAPDSHVPFSPSGKKVLEGSLQEALQLNHSYIGTEHLLLALLDEDDGAAGRVLSGLGVNPVQVRERVLDTVPRGNESARHQDERVEDAERLDRIEALLTDVVSRLDAIERRVGKQ